MNTKRTILKRVWSVVLAAAGLFTAPLSATLQAEEAAAVTAKDAVAVPEARESVLADVTAGASARKVMKGSQTYVWDETNVIKVNSADELNSALSTSGDGHKSIRIMNSFDISIDITSSIDATIDLNGKTLSSFSAGHMILINNVSLSLFDGSADGDGRVDLNANTLFLVDEFSTLNIYGGKFSGFGEGSAVINNGTTNVYGGNFADLKKGIDNAAGTLNIYGGEFSGDDSGTGVYNSGTANVYGGKFENLVMGIYNAGSLNLYALPVVGAGNNANSTADIGLAPEKVITMSMVGSSLPENYEKMKVGQFTYAASSGYSAAGSAPYVVTSGYHANLKGIHPAQMFVAYDGDATDNVSYELCLKGGSDADAGEAQIAEVAGDAVTWTNPGGDGGGGGINILSLGFRQWADGAVISLNRNIDLGDDYLDLKPDDTRTSFTFDLNGHLLTGSPGGNGIFNIEGMKVTICDSGTGGMMAVNRGNSISAVSISHGSLTITGGSFFSEGDAIVNVSGTLSVTGGTLTGEGRAVLNRGGGTADISGGSFFGANGYTSAIDNAGTMTLGCGDGAVSIIGGSGPPAVSNSGTLTVGSHASIMSSGRAAINNPGTLNVAGFPSFDAANACDVMLSKFSNGTNSVISFTGDITAAPAAPVKVTVTDGYNQPVALGDEPLLITSGYGAHVTYPAGHAQAGAPIDPEEVFTYKPYGTPVVSVRPRLVGEGDAAEVEFWLPKATVAYVDADGKLHDDLDGSTPDTDDDGAEAYVLGGTETVLGVVGEDTWYVALPADKNGGRDLTGYGNLTLRGNVHLILADGAEMKAAVDDAIINDDGSLTLYGQSEQTGVLSAENTADGSYVIDFSGADLVINGGCLTAKGTNAENDIYLYDGNLTVNGGTIFDTPKLNIINGNATINGGRLTGNREIINPGQEDSYTDYLGLLDVSGGDIFVTGGVITGYDLAANIISSRGGNVTISGGTLDCASKSIYSSFSTTVSGGKIIVNNLNILYRSTFLSLSNDDDYIRADNFFCTPTIPQGSYLGDGERVFGSADADYLFGADGHASTRDINGKTLVKATPLATGGLYLAYDNPSGASLLTAGTVALYPTGIKFTEQADGSFTAEVVLSDQPLPGVPQGCAVILASATDGAPLSDVWLMASTAVSGEGKTPEALKDAYDARTDRLINFVAADGTQTVAQLIAAATGRTAVTDADCSDYIVFVLSGDRFVAAMASPDVIPAAGRCLLVVPKLNMLRHLDMGDTSGGTTAGARTLRLGGGDNATTGILQLPADGDATAQEYFGLDGRPVGSRPLRKGVYIRRGSKLVVR